MFVKSLTAITLLLFVVLLRGDEYDSDYSIGGGMYELDIEPKNPVLSIGEEVTLECNVVNNPDAVIRDEEFKWKKGDMDVHSGKRLVLRVDNDVFGEYQCSVGDSVATSTIRTRADSLSTATRPYDENKVNIICAFTNHPSDSNQYTFEWVDKSGQRISSLPNDVMNIEDLRNKQPLTCRATHSNGRTLQAGLTFESLISPSLLTSTVQNVKAHIQTDKMPADDEPLVLSNVITGRYTRIISYTWKKDGVVLSSTPIYKIESLTDSAKGFYTCDIVAELEGNVFYLQTKLNLNSNEEYEDEDEFNLSITPKSPIQLKVNKLMELHCTISGNSAYSSSSIRWSFIPKNGREMPLQNWEIKEVTSQTSTIKKIVTAADIGEYVCKVDGTYKSVSSKIIKRKSTWSVESQDDQTQIQLTMEPNEIRVQLNDKFSFICEVKGGSGNVLPIAVSPSGIVILTRPVGPNKIEITGTATRENIPIECKLQDISVTGRVIAGCGQGLKSCPDGRCIQNSASCDGNVSECDPIIRSCETHNGQISSKAKYNVNWECDGENDCGNGFDEADCSNRAREICGKEYTCPSGNKKIPLAYVCDGEPDCNGGDDESDCSNPTIISTIEPRYMARYGSSVSLRCEASGKPAPRIIWRFNWGCLPGQGMGQSQIPYLSAIGIDRFKVESVIQNCNSNRPTVVSTLTIQNFRDSDAGFYNCEAISGQNRHLSENYDVQKMQNY